ncbi:MAG: GAF domain-containing protein [Candidatus Krumholzibacteriota bacterium]|nr:GAF domain-containing protein [Candidatus Krumholzibacteriota bacterium]
MTDEQAGFDDILDEARRLLAGKESVEERLVALCRLLRRRVDHYHWVGFYVADPPRRELRLGPYVGDPTEHVTIPYGRGVCGQVAESGTPMIVQDVQGEDNYLCCSPSVRSEIVVPIFLGGALLAEIDIDSHDESPFTDGDLRFLGLVGALAAPLLGRAD